MSDGNTQGAYFVAMDLRCSDLTRGNLKEGKLGRSDLSGATLSAVQLKGTKLKGAKLRGANFTKADLSTAFDLDQMELDKTCNSDASQLPDLPEGFSPLKKILSLTEMSSRSCQVSRLGNVLDHQATRPYVWRGIYSFRCQM